MFWGARVRSVAPRCWQRTFLGRRLSCLYGGAVRRNAIPASRKTSSSVETAPASTSVSRNRVIPNLRPLSSDRSMNGSGRGFPFPDPEISTALDGEPGPLRALHYLHSERLESLLVEGAAAPHVTYSQDQVIDEGKRPGQRHPSILEPRSRGNIPARWGSSGSRTDARGLASGTSRPAERALFSDR